MGRAEEQLVKYNADFKLRAKGLEGYIIGDGITPYQYPVTMISGLTYHVTFEYMCNSPGCFIKANIYRSPAHDYKHHMKELKYSPEIQKEEFVLTCEKMDGVMDGFVRLWGEAPRRRVLLMNVKVASTNTKQMEARMGRRERKKAKIRPRAHADIELAKKEALNIIALKEAPITFFAYIKDEGKYYLERMIKSFVDYVNEFVIVDTGSTDNTKEILDRYKEYENLKVFWYPSGEGDIHKSINKALKEIKNKWIFITAGDEAMLKEDLFKIPQLLKDLKGKRTRAVRVSYLDFVKDFYTYHTKYQCTATRIWKNTKGFHFGGDWQGDIYMGYSDGVQTGGVETKKNMPKWATTDRLDIFFHHYARCKPKPILLDKRIKYYGRRMPKATKAEIVEAAKKCPFYTLDLPTKAYRGKQAGIESKLKIGFYTRGPEVAHFAAPILDKLRTFGHRIYPKYEDDTLDSLYNRLDWLWVEWGDTWARRILAERRRCKVVVRIHRYELSKKIATAIKWENADLLWFINRDVMYKFKRKFPHIKVPMIFIPNAVDMSRLPLIKRESYGKNIILYSIYFNDVKDYPLAIKLFQRLSKRDPKFSMTIRATPLDRKQQYERCTQSAQGSNIAFITGNIDLGKLANKDDINQLLADKDILLSTSKEESFHYSIAEALAKGLQVFVRGWNRKLSPEIFWGPYICKSEDEMIHRILDWSKLSLKRKRKISQANRDYVEEHFGSDRIAFDLLSKLTGNLVPHVGVIMPVYNNEKYLKKTIQSLLEQEHPNITVLAVDDGSTDKTREIIESYKGKIAALHLEHKGAHAAMAKGLEAMKSLNVDYTIFCGSDDIYEPNYVKDMVEMARDEAAYLVYPNFNTIDGDGNVTETFISQPPDINVLKSSTYICDHSLVSAKWWDHYGWRLRVDEFDAYSIFHVWLSMFKEFPDKPRWINKTLWNRRVYGENLHIKMKGKRQGQRAKVVKDVLG